MKTIKELSEELGITKVGLSKAIEREGLKSRLTQQGNTYLISEELEADIRAIFDRREPKHRQADTDTNKTVEPTQSEIIEILREELREKNEQIARLTELNLQLSIGMREQSSTVRLLTGGTDTPTINADVEVSETEHKEQESKGLFSRLFK